MRHEMDPGGFGGVYQGSCRQSARVFEDGMVLGRYTASLVGPIEAVLAVKLWQAISLSTAHLCQTLVRWENRESSNSRRTALLLAHLHAAH